MKAYTDIEQSKKLAEILPIESADMWYWEYPSAPKYSNYEYPMFHRQWGVINIPCWSITALFEYLKHPLERLDVSIRTDKNYNVFALIDNLRINLTDENNLVDACYKIILELHEQKLL